MTYRVGIDIGGTFTDFALLKGEDVILHKNLSTPEDRSVGVMEGLGALAAREGLSLGDFLGACEAIVHGTTVADNTLIEMNGALTGLITTEGFRDEIEYRRGFKEDIWDVRLEPPRQITPRRRRLTVPERILHDGTVHQPLDEEALREACRKLRLQNVEAVAISFLFSFVNPEHERRAKEIVTREIQNAYISASHEVLPRAPEYDRTSTTIVNAYVGPRVTAYLERLVTRLAEGGYRNQLMVMQASGGVMTKDYIDGAPIRVLASGPAGGVIGSAHCGKAKGHPNLLCVDMGGTSYDMSVVVAGEAPAEAGWNMHHRYLIGVPMVKVETLGAGGGSICHVNAGALEVGPKSAGSEPGPICYGRGGTRPTVTDALVMLGILSTDEGFAGGSFRLTRDGVDAAFQAVGDEMGYGAEDAAFDCWRVVNANMSQGVRRTTAGKGIDPKDLVMLAYGGNGPAFAAIQAEDLGITKVLVPKASPTFSALGTLVANPTIDEERSYIASAHALDLDRVRQLWHDLSERARRYFTAARFTPEQMRVNYQLNMRYPGQNFSLSFDFRADAKLGDLSFMDDGFGERAIALFNQRHMAEYNHIREHEVPEVSGVRLAAHVTTPSPRVTAGFTASAGAPVPAKHRRANLGQGFGETPVYLGRDLRPGMAVPSPAIIEETFTTIVVYPGWTARVDDAGDYELVKG
ncbi:hydantoinase/oxoprolinase family protein [Novosphingobium album (ex Liu et al. 2023)]|uniref:Hydantoinase/oxoprolinase family protein n=1 Tax=Novosphingobium album (ex Liu et al. 2023) TaxID=3031130 RepID=A0ABT5WJS8_9SPHN|nr:hydantoinase/oxoprolinase family protein [Novosphingobium album (ex Liu et al. 2023)]MDE8650297.1 hydantoinase/oxoprolinase family protein [Novosphingobium album (ex Liu et al. 2023)]